MDKAAGTDLVNDSGGSQFSVNFNIFVEDIVAHLCEKKNIDMPKEFILSMIKLVALNPDNKFLIKQQMVETEIQRLKMIVIERIVGMSELSRNIILMQLHYRDKWQPRDAVIVEARKEITEKVGHLIGQLRESVPTQIRQYELYYNRLAGATIYFCNMGPDTEPSVVTETLDAIAKIFDKEDICLLIPMTSKEREFELMNIVGIACGLRLFEKHKHPDDCGFFIEDLAKRLPRKIHDNLKQLKSMKSLHTGRLIAYTTAIKKYFIAEINIRAGRRELSAEMVKARQGLSMVHQVLIYIKQLTTEMNIEEKHIEGVTARYWMLMKSLLADKPKKNGYPATSSYAKLVELGDCWQCLMDSNFFVTVRTTVATEIHQFAENELLAMDDFIQRLLQVLKRKLPSEELFFKYPFLRVELDSSQNIKRIEYQEDCDDIDFNGFCLNSFVAGSGLCLLPNPNLGVFLWSDFKLMFATPEDAKAFSKNPDRCFRRAARIAQRWPELIFLLDIEHLVYHPSSLRWTDDAKNKMNYMISKNAGMQCETHPMISNIVESYTWNEWELRRRGIVLSKIHQSRTHGTQTHLQALRKTVECQTYGKKSTEVQTNSNVHTSVPRTKFYFAGLRGYHCGMPPHVVELTSEIPDDLHCVCKPLPPKEPEKLVDDEVKKHKRMQRASLPSSRRYSHVPDPEFN